MKNDSTPAPRTDESKPPGNRSQRLRPSGGYRHLRSFQSASLIYDATVAFCARFLDKRSRTVDQMVQAARSGRQNIAEGSRASAISSQTELRLVNVARGSLDELLLDYEDYLRQRGLPLWLKDSIEARAVRQMGAQRHPTDRSDPSDQELYHHWALYASWLEHSDPATVANTILCLIHQTNYLLDQQIHSLEHSFIHSGGYTEQLAAARIAQRQRDQRAAPVLQPANETPLCPCCAKPMELRAARQGKYAGTQFWGCAAYPACQGIRRLDRSDRTD